MRDPYLISHTDVLSNLLQIEDSAALATAELEFTSIRLAQLSTRELDGQFDFSALCHMHYYIFQDIYDWAGKPRMINIEKSEPSLGGISIEYSDCFDIVKDAEYILGDMNCFSWEKASFAETVKNYSRFMADLWKVHPFREGNTRTIVTFCNCFMSNKGYEINTDLYKDNAEYVRAALVAASASFHDLGDKRKPEYIEKIVADSLREGWQKREKRSVLGQLKENQRKVEKEKDENIQTDRGKERYREEIEK